MRVPMKTMPIGRPGLSPIGTVRLGVAGDRGGAVAGAEEMVAVDVSVSQAGDSRRRDQGIQGVCACSAASMPSAPARRRALLRASM